MAYTNFEFENHFSRAETLVVGLQPVWFFCFLTKCYIYRIIIIKKIIFSRVINLLLTKLAWDLTGRISARPRADILPVQPSRLFSTLEKIFKSRLNARPRGKFNVEWSIKHDSRNFKRKDVFIVLALFFIHCKIKRTKICLQVKDFIRYSIWISVDRGKRLLLSVSVCQTSLQSPQFKLS